MTEQTIHVWQLDLGASQPDIEQNLNAAGQANFGNIDNDNTDNRPRMGFMHKLMSKIGGAELSISKWAVKDGLNTSV